MTQLGCWPVFAVDLASLVKSETGRCEAAAGQPVPPVATPDTRPGQHLPGSAANTAGEVSGAVLSDALLVCCAVPGLAQSAAATVHASRELQPAYWRPDLCTAFTRPNTESQQTGANT